MSLTLLRKSLNGMVGVARGGYLSLCFAQFRTENHDAVFLELP